MATADDFRRELTRELLGEDRKIVPLGCRALSACDCGCGRPKRIEFEIGAYTVAVCDPIQIDLLIDMMTEGRRLLWGGRPGGGGSSTAKQG